MSKWQVELCIIAMLTNTGVHWGLLTCNCVLSMSYCIRPLVEVGGHSLFFYLRQGSSLGPTWQLCTRNETFVYSVINSEAVPGHWALVDTLHCVHYAYWGQTRQCNISEQALTTLGGECWTKHHSTPALTSVTHRTLVTVDVRGYHEWHPNPPWHQRLLVALDTHSDFGYNQCS